MATVNPRGIWRAGAMGQCGTRCMHPAVTLGVVWLSQRRITDESGLWGSQEEEHVHVSWEHTVGHCV